AEYDREIAYARVHTGTGNLVAKLGLSRGPIEGLPQQLSGEEAGALTTCPLEGPMPYTVDKAALNARAMDILKESAAVSQAAQAAATVSAPAAAVPAAGNAAAGSRQAAGPAAVQAVSAALSAWVNAWQAGDIAGYLASYAPGFQPAGNATRAAWEA